MFWKMHLILIYKIYFTIKYFSMKKKLDLSKLLSKDNYQEIKLSKDIKDNILKQTIYKKHSFLSKFKFYALPSFAILLIFVFWFYFYEINKNSFVNQENQKNINIWLNNIENQEVWNFEENEEIQENSIQNFAKNRSLDQISEDVEMFDTDSSNDIEQNIGTYSMEESNTWFGRAWFGAKTVDVASSWVYEKDDFYNKLKKYFVENYIKFIILSILIIINILILFYTYKYFSLNKKMKILLIISFFVDILLFYYVIFILI